MSSIEQPMRGWFDDPFGRFDERYFIDGRPTDRVRSTVGSRTRSFEDPMPGTFDFEEFAVDSPPVIRARAQRTSFILAGIAAALFVYAFSIGALAHVTINEGAVDCGTALSPATDLGPVGSAQCSSAGLTGDRTQAFVAGALALSLLVIAAIRALGSQTTPPAWVDAPWSHGPEVDPWIGGAAGESSASSFVGTRTCLWCAETVRAAALICRFCGHPLSPPERSEAEFVSFGGRPPGRPGNEQEERGIIDVTPEPAIDLAPPPEALPRARPTDEGPPAA